MNHAVSGGTLGPGHRCLRRTLFHCSLNVPVTAPGWKVHCLSPLVIPQVLLARHPPIRHKAEVLPAAGTVVRAQCRQTDLATITSEDATGSRYSRLDHQTHSFLFVRHPLPAISWRYFQQRLSATSPQNRLQYNIELLLIHVVVQIRKPMYVDPIIRAQTQIFLRGSWAGETVGRTVCGPTSKLITHLDRAWLNFGYGDRSSPQSLSSTVMLSS